LDIKDRFAELERKLSMSTDVHVHESLQQFKTSMNYSFTHFESMSAIEPMTSLVERKVHDGARYSGPLIGANV
jgi:hypothetical protein